MNLRSKIQNLKESSQDGVTLKNILGEYKSDNRTNVSISSSLFSVGFDEKKKKEEYELSRIKETEKTTTTWDHVSGN